MIVKKKVNWTIAQGVIQIKYSLDFPKVNFNHCTIVLKVVG